MASTLNHDGRRIGGVVLPAQIILSDDENAIRCILVEHVTCCLDLVMNGREVEPSPVRYGRGIPDLDAHDFVGIVRDDSRFTPLVVDPRE